MIDWAFLVEIGFWIVVLVIPIVYCVSVEQTRSREKEAERRRLDQEKSLWK